MPLTVALRGAALFLERGSRASVRFSAKFCSCDVAGAYRGAAIA